MSAEDKDKNQNISEREVIADSRNSGTDKSESSVLRRDTRRDGKIDIGLDFNYDSDVAKKKARMKNASGKGVRPVTTYIAPDDEDALLDFFAPPDEKEDLLLQIIADGRERTDASAETIQADRYTPADTIQIDKSAVSGQGVTDKLTTTDTIQADKLVPADTIQMDRIRDEDIETSDEPAAPEIPELTEEPETLPAEGEDNQEVPQIPAAEDASGNTVTINTIWLDPINTEAALPEERRSLTDTIQFNMDGEEVPSIFERAYVPETDDVLRLIEENIDPGSSNADMTGLKKTGEIDLSGVVRTKGLGVPSDATGEIDMSAIRSAQSESYGLIGDPLAEINSPPPDEPQVPSPSELWAGFQAGAVKYAGKFKGWLKSIPELVKPPALPPQPPADDDTSEDLPADEPIAEEAVDVRDEEVPAEESAEEIAAEEPAEEIAVEEPAEESVAEEPAEEITDEELAEESAEEIPASEEDLTPEDEYTMEELPEDLEAVSDVPEEDQEVEQTLEELVKSDDTCSRKMLVLSGALSEVKGKSAKTVKAGSKKKSTKTGGKSAAKKKAVSKAKQSDAAKSKYIAAEAAKTSKTSGSDKSVKSKDTDTAGNTKPKKKPPLKESDFKKAKPKKRKGKIRTFFGTIIAVMLLLIFAGGCAGVGYVAYTVSQAEPIQPKSIYDSLETTTYIYDDKDKLFDEVYYSENRQITTYEQLPDNLKNAFIAVEDKTFWTHKGFNFRRIIGAIIEKFHGGSISGTSTITQQLARNVFLPEEKSIRSIKRKITEMYYAYEIEEELSKEDIITAYLNTIYLGYGCYGVDTAARKYFDCSVENLTLEQCAALAALPQAPGTYQLLTTEEDEYTTKLKDGLYANDVSKERRDMILGLMAEQGYITAEERDAAIKPLTDFIKPGTKHEAASRSAFKDYLIEVVRADLMKTYELTEEQADKLIYTKGLRIYSTLDSQAQKAINKQFSKKENFPTTVKKDVTPEAAMVIAEVGTGKIKAMVGTRKVTGQMLFNRATNPRQPGSSIKPLTVYSAALQKSYELHKAGKKYNYVKTGYDKQGTSGWGSYITTTSTVIDEKMKVKGKTWPQNATKSYSGRNTFRTAMYKSINTCAVKILAQVGIDYSMDMLHKYGISTVVDDYSESVNDINLAALGLGAMTQGVTPLDMAIAYTVFPNGGVRYSPTCYTRVEDSNGKVLLEAQPEKTRVLNEGVAWIMTNVLQGDVKYGIAGNAAIDGTPVGGKTGTTNDQYDIWFDGFTPKYAAALWIGTDQNVEMNSMSEKAAALWSKVMRNVERAQGGKFRSQPDNVIYWYGDYYTKGTQPPPPKPKEKKEDKKDGDKKADGAASGTSKPAEAKKP